MAETFEDLQQALKNQLRQIRGGPEARPGYVPVRVSPKGTYLESDGPGTVTLRFKAAIRFWWMLPYFLMLVTIFVGFPLASSLAYAAAFPYGFSLPTFLIVMALFLVPTIGSFRWTRPWVKLVATPDAIVVGKQRFDRQHYGGMRLGYEMPSGGDILKNDFHDISVGMQALRLSYGPWGEDLPYLVSKYHSTEIVGWMNMMIAPTADRPVRSSVASEGIRTQRF